MKAYNRKDPWDEARKSRVLASAAYKNKVNEIANSDLYKALRNAEQGSYEFYELDDKFERVLRNASNSLGIGPLELERDIYAAYLKTA